MNLKTTKTMMTVSWLGSLMLRAQSHAMSGKNLKSKQVPTAVSHNQELDQDDEESFADAVPKRKQRARESEHASVSKPRDERKEVKAKRTERSATRIDDLQEEEIRDGVSDEQDILPPPTSADKRKKKKFSKKVSF